MIRCEGFLKPAFDHPDGLPDHAVNELVVSHEGITPCDALPSRTTESPMGEVVVHE